MLVSHVLKRSAGISMGGEEDILGEKVGEAADGFVVIISATGFLEVSLDIFWPYSVHLKILI